MKPITRRLLFSCATLALAMALRLSLVGVAWVVLLLTT